MNETLGAHLTALRAAEDAVHALKVARQARTVAVLSLVLIAVFLFLKLV